MAHLIGEDNMMWGADYPHPDGVWPDSRQIIRDTMGGLEAGLLSKIVCDNAVDRYRIGSVSNIRTLLQSVASIATMEATRFFGSSAKWRRSVFCLPSS